METTGKDLVHHWDWASEKGLMNAKTASGLRSACVQVLGALGDDWENAEIRELNSDEIFRRFQNLRSKDFKPDSLRAYEQRFKQALDSFLKYVDDPSNWKAPGEERPRNNSQSSSHKRPKNGNKGADQTDSEPLPPSSIKFEVPIPGRGIARFIVPAEISEADLEMINAVLRAYVKRAAHSEAA